mmetsp:Transcript_6245/g.7200  ORF Transcript_6245/g.7200 Transcript_6245/m.7200 type:complete len:233 (-) Transcript_6245:12-710(-)
MPRAVRKKSRVAALPSKGRARRVRSCVTKQRQKQVNKEDDEKPKLKRASDKQSTTLDTSSSTVSSASCSDSSECRTEKKLSPIKQWKTRAAAKKKDKKRSCDGNESTHSRSGGVKKSTLFDSSGDEFDDSSPSSSTSVASTVSTSSSTKPSSTSGLDSESSTSTTSISSDQGKYELSFRPEKRTKKRDRKAPRSTGKMVLSKRLSYRLTRPNITPMKSPIVAVELSFTQESD